jgi:hypothetical protein
MKTAFFYHVRLSGGHNVDSGASIDNRFGRAVFQNQFLLMESAGLLEADEFVACVNGPRPDFFEVARIFPHQPNLSVVHNGEDAESLLPTMQKLQEWLLFRKGWAVGLAHMKGVTHPGNPMIQKWADCLNYHTITNWRQNVADLESGQYDACGCHWTHNSPNDPNAARWGSNSYFAGGFWWATVDYLLTLPKIPVSKPRDRHDWFLPELLLGCGNPRVKDYHPGPVTNHT